MTELHPAPEHADKPLHWIQEGADPPEVAFWETSDLSAWSAEGPRCRWRLHDETRQYEPRAPQLSGYRYLGPAEWYGSSLSRLARYQARVVELELELGRLTGLLAGGMAGSAGCFNTPSGWWWLDVDNRFVTPIPLPPELKAEPPTHLTPFPPKAMR